MEGLPKELSPNSYSLFKSSSVYLEHEHPAIIKEIFVSGGVTTAYKILNKKNLWKFLVTN